RAGHGYQGSRAGPRRRDGGMRALTLATLFAAAAGYVVMLVAGRALGPADYPLFATYWGAFFALGGVANGLMQETTRAVRSARRGRAARADPARRPADGAGPGRARGREHPRVAAARPAHVLRGGRADHGRRHPRLLDPGRHRRRPVRDRTLGDVRGPAHRRRRAPRAGGGGGVVARGRRPRLRPGHGRRHAHLGTARG